MHSSTLISTLPDYTTASCSSGASLDVQVPEPPRRSDGKIDWNKISDEFLAAILKKISRSELAAAWKITRGGVFQQIKKRKAKRGLADVADEEMFSCRPYQYERPSKLTLLVLLWTMPATHIARLIGCSQATILGWAKEDGLKRPGHGYWQRMNNGIKVEVPAEVIALYMRLRAEASPEERGGVPEVFRSSETQAATAVDKPADIAPENANEPTKVSELERAKGTSNSNTKEHRRIILKLSKADLLERRWLQPATRVAEELNISHSALRQKCRVLGLGPFLPPEEHWRSRKSGDPIIIPEEIQKVIAQLRAEPVADTEEMIVVLGHQAADAMNALQDQSLPPISAAEPGGNAANLKFRPIPFPGPRLPEPPFQESNSCVGIGTCAPGALHGRHGRGFEFFDVPFVPRQLSIRSKRHPCAIARGSPARWAEPERFDPIIYGGFAELSEQYDPLVPAHCRGP